LNEIIFFCHSEQREESIDERAEYGFALTSVRLFKKGSFPRIKSGVRMTKKEVAGRPKGAGEKNLSEVKNYGHIILSNKIFS
jgi:hypothetical protein